MSFSIIWVVSSSESAPMSSETTATTSIMIAHINAMLYSQTGAYSGYGFAIPTSIMNKVVDDIP
ncbi:hypothetical protein ABVC73_00250 [Prevotella melaninogenica]